VTLDELFESAKTRAQAAPSDLKARSALWQIFAARGEFARAKTQLDNLMRVDPSWALEVQSCYGLISAEETRLKVFAGTQPPTCLGSPPEWFGALAAALPLFAAGQSSAALELVAQVQDQCPALQGDVNGEPFNWICDGDARLGPCLEVVAQGGYYWVPFAAITSMSSEPPTELRDRIWQRAMLDIANQGAIEVFLPARYPLPVEDAHRMAGRTDWQELSETMFTGSGQKVLFTDQRDIGLLDIRSLGFTAPAA